MNALFLAAVLALNPLTVNQGVVGSSPTSGAKINGLEAVSTPARPINTLPSNTRGVASVRLYTEVSRPGEWMDGFVLRISRRAVVRGEALRSEVCGVIVPRPDGLFELTLYTTRQTRACVTPAQGGIASFHTHPRDGGGHEFSDADYAAHGYMAIGSRVYHQAGRGTEREVIAD